MKVLSLMGALLIAGCSVGMPPALSVEEQVREIRVCTENGLSFDRVYNNDWRVAAIHCKALEKTP